MYFLILICFARSPAGAKGSLSNFSCEKIPGERERFCKDARGRGRDHGAKRRNSSLSIIPLDYQRLRDLHPILRQICKVGYFLILLLLTLILRKDDRESKKLYLKI